MRGVYFVLVMPQWTFCCQRHLKSYFFFSCEAICETEPEQPVRHYPLWVKVEGEVDPEPVYIPTPSVIEPTKPLLLPQPEVLSTAMKGKLLSGIKPARAYTPKPNPVVSLEFHLLLKVAEIICKDWWVSTNFQFIFCESFCFQVISCKPAPFWFNQFSCWHLTNVLKIEVHNCILQYSQISL